MSITFSTIKQSLKNVWAGIVEENKRINQVHQERLDVMTPEERRSYREWESSPWCAGYPARGVWTLPCPVDMDAVDVRRQALQKNSLNTAVPEFKNGS